MDIWTLPNVLYHCYVADTNVIVRLDKILARAREAGSPLKAAARTPTKGHPRPFKARLKGGLFHSLTVFGTNELYTFT